MRDRGSQVWGALLIVVGVVLLLGSLGVLGGLVPFIWGLLFGAAGVVFLYVFLRRHDNWWAIYPAMALLGVGSVIVINAAAPPGGAAWSGGLLLAFLALAFWIVYLRLRDAWWPLILPNWPRSRDDIPAFRAGDTGLIPHTFLEMIPHTENTPARTLPVASAKPNAWGFYDMMSNVSEWGKKEHTLSWRHRPPIAQTWSMDLYRTGVVMGGSTAHKPNRCNYLRMYSESSNARFRTIGFRVALVRTPSSHLFSDASNN